MDYYTISSVLFQYKSVCKAKALHKKVKCPRSFKLEILHILSERVYFFDSAVDNAAAAQADNVFNAAGFKQAFCSGNCRIAVLISVCKLSPAAEGAF